jgi:AcrR family transcriptional regulator
MLFAMTEAVAENGFASTPVAEVLRRARVSRETFYEHFANREDCFLAAYEASVGLVMDAMEDAVLADADADTDRRLARGLELYLATMAQAPAAARTFMVEVYGAGEAALARRNEVQARFVDQVAAWVGAESAEERFACEITVAAVIGLVTQRICAGRTSELASLHDPLMHHLESLLAAYGLPAGAQT